LENSKNLFICSQNLGEKKEEMESHQSSKVILSEKKKEIRNLLSKEITTRILKEITTRRSQPKERMEGEQKEIIINSKNILIKHEDIMEEGEPPEMMQRSNN
jgi:hypothetical protein